MDWSSGYSWTEFYYEKDISEEELLKAPPCYEKIIVDATSVDLNINKKFDVVFSKMFLEHIKNPQIHQCFSPQF